MPKTRRFLKLACFIGWLASASGFAQDMCLHFTISGCVNVADWLAQHPNSTCTTYLGFTPGTHDSYAVWDNSTNPPTLGCYTSTICPTTVPASCSVTAPPANSAQETGATCSGCTAGQPINLSNGNTYIDQTDVAVPGLGGGLRLSRRWNSLWPVSQSGTAVGLFGPNWRSTYEERISWASDGTMKYARADGSFWSFAATHSNWQLIAPSNESATLVTAASGWSVTFKSGEVRQFDPNSGSLVSIGDRNGNVIQIAYDGQNRLTTVTDPAGRHLSLSYADTSSRLVRSLTSDVGITLSYDYDQQGRLSRVTKPDQSYLTFEYDTNSFITAVKDSHGNIVEAHTYDTYGRGLSSSRADGVEALIVSYPVSPTN
jgi:YD repeat-containing protein